MLRISPATRPQPLISAGAISEKEAALGLAALGRWSADPAALLLTVGLLVCGEKAR